MLNVDVQLRLLKYQEDTAKLLEDAENIEYIVAKLIDDIRNMSVELRPASLDDLGLEAAFKSYFKQFEENYGVKIIYTSNIKIPVLIVILKRLFTSSTRSYFKCVEIR